MTSDVCGTVEKIFISAEQISDIVCLQYQQHDPIYASNDSVQAERCERMIVLSPYGMAVMLLLAIRSLDGVDCANDEDEKP